MTPKDAAKFIHQVREEIGQVIVGQDELIADILIAFFAGGHVLLE